MKFTTFVSQVQTARQAPSMPQSFSSREVQYKIFTKEGTRMEPSVFEPRLHPWNLKSAIYLLCNIGKSLNFITFWGCLLPALSQEKGEGSKGIYAEHTMDTQWPLVVFSNVRVGGVTNAVGVSIFMTFPADGICIIDICSDRIISDMTEYSNFHPPGLQQSKNSFNKCLLGYLLCARIYSKHVCVCTPMSAHTSTLYCLLT